MALLEMVAKKGIKIEIFIPRDTDIKFLNRTNRIYVNELSNLKINFYVQNKMNHAKVLIIDDKETLIGSQNLDIVSFYINLESGVSISNKKLIDDLNKIIKKWKRDSIKFPKIKKKLSIWDRIILGIIKFFYSIL
jgi:cardiolipin synthase